MNQPSARGVQRQGVDAAFEADETRKSQLMLDVHFVSPAPVERHARVGGHPVPMALVSWIPAFAGMTRCRKNWQCIYEMDI